MRPRDLSVRPTARAEELMTWDNKDNPCTSKDGATKRKWATENAAIFIARQDQRADGKKRYHYYCPNCLKWHTTKSPPRKKHAK